MRIQIPFSFQFLNSETSQSPVWVDFLNKDFQCEASVLIQLNLFVYLLLIHLFYRPFLECVCICT